MTCAACGTGNVAVNQIVPDSPPQGAAPAAVSGQDSGAGGPAEVYFTLVDAGTLAPRGAGFLDAASRDSGAFAIERAGALVGGDSLGMLWLESGDSSRLIRIEPETLGQDGIATLPQAALAAAYAKGRWAWIDSTGAVFTSLGADPLALPSGTGAATALAISPDGASLAVTYGSGTTVYRLSSLKGIANLGQGDVAFSPAGDRVAYYSNGALHALELANGADTRFPTRATTVSELAWLDRDTLAFVAGAGAARELRVSGIDGETTVASLSLPAKGRVACPAGLGGALYYSTIESGVPLVRVATFESGGDSGGESGSWSSRAFARAHSSRQGLICPVVATQGGSP